MLVALRFYTQTKKASLWCDIVRSIQKVLMAQIQNLSLMRFFYNMRTTLCVFDERFRNIE